MAGEAVESLFQLLLRQFRFYKDSHLESFLVSQIYTVKPHLVATQ